MSESRYLKDRARLYLLFFATVAVISALILLLPYDTVYVREEAYLDAFLVIVVVCVFVFFLGTLYNVLIWMHGKGLVGAPEGRFIRLLARAFRFVFSRRLAKAMNVLYWEAIHLPKLKEASVTRWFTHFLILGGFVLTFVLDLIVTVSLDFFKYKPMIEETGWAKVLFRDFMFELTGMMMLIGLTIVAVRRFIVRPKMLRTELPDAASVVFLLAVVLGGFILEAVGIAGSIPGHTVNQQYSFFGHALSLVMPSAWGAHYDQVWLIHGVISALLIAYIPFSKLFHMIASPVAIEADKMLSKEVSS